MIIRSFCQDIPKSVTVLFIIRLEETGLWVISEPRLVQQEPLNFVAISSIYKAMMIAILGLNSLAYSSEYEQDTTVLVGK